MFRINDVFGSQSADSVLAYGSAILGLWRQALVHPIAVEGLLLLRASLGLHLCLSISGSVFERCYGWPAI